MRASVLSDWLAQRLVRGGEQPIYRQLHRLLQQAILSRELPAGTRVPSSRLHAEPDRAQHGHAGLSSLRSKVM